MMSNAGCGPRDGGKARGVRNPKAPPIATRLIMVLSFSLEWRVPRSALFGTCEGKLDSPLLRDRLHEPIELSDLREIAGALSR